MGGRELVNIVLANQNELSQCREVNINIATGICTLADNQVIELKRLMSEFDFSHPLIPEPYVQISGHLFHYEYDDIDGLLGSARYVYSMLLRVDNPLNCQFKINPSRVFRHSKASENVYFSIKGDKLAEEPIRVRQLEDIVSHLSGYTFKFSEDILIDDLFTIADLPSSIDGSLLDKTDVNILDLLKMPNDLSRYEIRYINPDIGLGVFSRDVIKKGDVIGVYSGVKNTRTSADLSYLFHLEFDCLKMYIDARQYGNITRFINHAPEADINKIGSNRSSFLEANIGTSRFYLNGIEVVVYTTIKDILKGEQLLVDYGQAYFENMTVSRFKSSGKVICMTKKIIRSTSQKKIRQIRIMARHGVEKAQTYLLLRIVSIVVVISILIGILNYVSF